MDIFAQIREQLLVLPHVQTWPELQNLLDKAVSTRPDHWLLPVPGCQAVGGTLSQAFYGIIAIGCLHTSIILLDDMLDADPRGAHNYLGESITSNFASALQATGVEAIALSGCPVNTQLAVTYRLNEMMVMTAMGQYWDVQNPQDEAAYWQIVQTKSAPLFSTALSIGALLGGATNEVATQVGRVGKLYGEMIQLNDDLKDVMESPANPDWLQGRTPLPILFAQSVPHPQRERFQELRHKIPAPEALTEAQQIIIRCGAVGYVAYQLLERYKNAKEMLAQIPLAQPKVIYQLLEEVVMPMQSLLMLHTGK